MTLPDGQSDGEVAMGTPTPSGDCNDNFSEATTEQKYFDRQSFEQSINFMSAWPYFDPSYSEYFPPQPPVMMNACEVCGETFGDALQLMTHRQSVHQLTDGGDMPDLQNYNAIIIPNPMNCAPAFLPPGFSFPQPVPFTPQQQTSSSLAQMQCDIKPSVLHDEAVQFAAMPHASLMSDIINDMPQSAGQKPAVRRHMQRVAKSTVCDLCGLKIKHKRNIYRHKRTCHNVVHKIQNGQITNKPFKREDGRAAAARRSQSSHSAPQPTPASTSLPMFSNWAPLNFSQTFGHGTPYPVKVEPAFV